MVVCCTEARIVYRPCPPQSYLVRIRQFPLLPDERALCSFTPEAGIIGEPIASGRLFVATDRRLLSFSGGDSGAGTFAAPIEEFRGVSIDPGSGSGVTLVQGIVTIAVGLLVYVVLAYWLTGQIQGPLVPFINIDLGPLVVLIAVLGGVWLAARQYFARDHGTFTFQGSNWVLALPFSKRVREPDIFRVVNAVFNAREGRLESLGLRPPPVGASDGGLCQR